jgi:hypothetical protein
MKISIRKTLAAALLSGTAALAAPAFAQEQPAAEGNQGIILPEGQGSAQQGSDTQGQASGQTEMKTGDGQAEASGAAKTPDADETGQSTAETESKPATDQTEAQKAQSTDEAPAQDSAQAEDDEADKTGRQVPDSQSAESQTDETKQPTTDSAEKATEGDNEDQTTAGTSPAADTNEAAAPATSNETTASIDISTEQRTEIRNVIVESDVKPVDVDIEVNVGTVIPRTVELRPLPPRIIEIVPAYRSYQYFLLADGRIVIVEPGSLKIIYVITA